MLADNINNDSITNILNDRMIDWIADNMANMLGCKIIHERASNTANIIINNISKDKAIILFNILEILREYEIGISKHILFDIEIEI